MSVHRVKQYIDAIYTEGLTISDLMKQYLNIDTTCNIILQERKFIVPKEILIKINENDFTKTGKIYDVSDMKVNGTGIRLVNFNPKTRKYFSEFGFISNKFEPVQWIFDTAQLDEDDEEYKKLFKFFNKS
jgi:hypothetical protein